MFYVVITLHILNSWLLCFLMCFKVCIKGCYNPAGCCLLQNAWSRKAESSTSQENKAGDEQKNTENTTDGKAQAAAKADEGTHPLFNFLWLLLLHTCSIIIKVKKGRVSGLQAEERYFGDIRQVGTQTLPSKADSNNILMVSQVTFWKWDTVADLKTNTLSTTCVSSNLKVKFKWASGSTHSSKFSRTTLYYT